MFFNCKENKKRTFWYKFPSRQENLLTNFKIQLIYPFCDIYAGKHFKILSLQKFGYKYIRWRCQFAEVFIKQPLTNIVKITAIKNLDYIFLFDVVKIIIQMISLGS